MKADVLSIFDTIKVCTHYNYKGVKTDKFPYNVEPENVQPIYVDMKGWNSDLTGLTNAEDMPKELMDYILFLEKELETPITVVSVGPDRKQTLIRDKALA